MAVAAGHDDTRSGERGGLSRRRPLSLRRRIFIASYLVAATTLVIAIASVLALRASNDWVDRRRVVLIPASAQVDRLLLALLDQQNGSRGYILSSDASFLDSYVEGRQVERDSSAQLRVLMADDAEVIGCLVRLASMSAVWHDDVVAPQIALVKAGRPDEAIEIVESGVGRESFAAIRAELDELASLLDVRLDDGGTRLDRWVAALGALAITGAAVAGIATLLVSVALRRGLTVPLERLSREATAVASGHLDTGITPGGPAEVDTVARSVEQMRRILLSEISASFNKGVVEAEQFERIRLAGELHDDPIQALSAAQWRLEASLPTIGEPERRVLEDVVTSLGDVQMRLRDLMFELHPPSLDTDGLAVALEDLLDETFVGSDVAVHLFTDIDDDLPPVLAGLAYRLAAEAVRNARRHAAPRNLTVTARFDRGIRVTVVDDGAGFDDPPVPEARHRGTQLGPALAAAAGGWWELSSRSSSAHPHDHGTTVSFWLPLTDDI